MSSDMSPDKCTVQTSSSGKKWLSITLLALCVVLTLSLWFSVSAVVPALKAAHGLSDSQAAWLASIVSVGFVAGTLISALFNFADRFEPRRLFMTSAFIGTVANAAILIEVPDSMAAIALRFLTGACMAGIYPVGLRIAATWATRDMGLLYGMLTAAICAGSGLPHLIDAFTGLDWRVTVGMASVLAAVAGLAINLVHLGPTHVRAPRFHPAFAARAITMPTLRLANLGYWGHKWENYAMWAWIGPFLHLSFIGSGRMPEAEAAYLARLATFGVFAVGALGCLLAGALADRFGRTLVASVALAVSGLCSTFTGFLLGAEPWLITTVCLIWGFALIADSAQFSASVTELSDRAYIGTMLTVQTCVGYLITLASIHVVEAAQSRFGWGIAFATLAIGPAIGIIAMIRLRRHPDAVRLASGRL